MNYVEWCELALRTMGDASAESAQIRNHGIDEQSLARRLWGERYEQITKNFKTEEDRDIVFNAVFDLYKELGNS